jgi:glycosyltransferase involved in cell wall biosynthesis
MTSATKFEPLVTIIICNYNYGRFIRAAVESALAQTYSNIEIIVVDDGSTDNSREVIDSFGDRVKAVYKENGGQPSGFNAGFAASSGEIICLLDSDDLFDRDKVAKVIDCFNKYSDAYFVFHPLRRVHIDGTDWGIHERMDGSRWLDYRHKVNKFTAPPTTGLSFRREAWKRLDPLPEDVRIFIDKYIVLVVMALFRGYYLAEALAVLRLHGDNLFSMGTSEDLRGPSDANVAWALRHRYPELESRADRIAAITLARYWKTSEKDGRTSKMLDRYLSGSSAASRTRVFTGAIMRYVRDSVIGDPQFGPQKATA